MFVDILGKTRLKLCLHTHTTLSDGKNTPNDTAQIYADAGYDAIAVTDAWRYGDEGEINGLKILSGCEYEFGSADSEFGVYHIVGLCTTSDPEVPEDWKSLTRTAAQKAAEAVKMIKQHNGLAILAHPAQSRNTPEQIMKLGELDGVEIYSGASESRSGAVADALASACRPLILLASDEDLCGGDKSLPALMVEAAEFDSQSIVRAIRAGRCYATQGPEIHIEQVSPEKIRVICSPADRIVFLSSTQSPEGYAFDGHGLVEAEYQVRPDDVFVRAEITDADGLTAWSNIIVLK